MPRFLFTNFATTRLAADITETSAAVQVLLGQGELFPAPVEAQGEVFALVLRKPSGIPEVMHCWKRESDILHVLRGREGTSAQGWFTDDKISLRHTAAALNLWASGEIGALAISASHVFVDDAARDTYFTENPEELAAGIYISVGTGFQQRNAANDAWLTKTALLQGPQGEIGDVTQDVVNARDAAIVSVEASRDASIGAVGTARDAAIGDLIPYVDAAEAARDTAETYANTVLETNALAYNPATPYSFPQVVVGSDGHTYRCMGTGITGEDPVTT